MRWWQRWRRQERQQRLGLRKQRNCGAGAGGGAVADALRSHGGRCSFPRGGRLRAVRDHLARAHLRHASTPFFLFFPSSLCSLNVSLAREETCLAPRVRLSPRKTFPNNNPSTRKPSVVRQLTAMYSMHRRPCPNAPWTDARAARAGTSLGWTIVSSTPRTAAPWPR